MSALGSVAKRAAKRFGYQVKRVAPAAYPELADVPRYTETQVPLLGHPFRVTDAASFLASYREIFEEEIYKFTSDRDQPVIVDCWANYGVSVVYLKSRYPGASIKAVEAGPRIFKMLNTNVTAAALQNVELINKAVSGSSEPVTFYSEGADDGRTRHLDDAIKAETIPAVTLDELIGDRVDFLKIDIEGAETEALASCTKLANVRQMFVEYHSFADSGQVLSDLLDILRRNGFRYYIHTQLCSPAPLSIDQVYMGMDLQLNIFANRHPL
ncbi:FkbM family methyltransferase [uncultured Sphingomonas sp.]|uniref:FkbM family methyltransferase n=1 Tax=uncultured Sphingomonas sp. TaxID=158754 RepID=UPI0035CB5E68